MDTFNFEKISSYEKDKNIIVPSRKTDGSAGYDFYAAEDTVIPSIWKLAAEIDPSIKHDDLGFATSFFRKEELPFSLDEISALNKEKKTKLTLVPTGIKCKIPNGWFLQLSVRSSLPLKHWLVLANGVGIIDADYYNNPDNEGHIYFQLINLSPKDIIIHKGDCFGQGVLLPYGVVNDESAPLKIRTGGFGSTNG